MRSLLLFLAVLLLAIVTQPVLAHGAEKHEETAAESSESANMDSGVRPSMESNGVSTDTDHDAHDGSIWTKLHPATVHFPIALLLTAALIELVAMTRNLPGLQSAVHVMVWGGAVGAIVAAAFGWIHTGLWLGGNGTMQWHRWTGTALALAVPTAAMLSARKNRIAFRVLLFVIAATLLAQGYLGGELAHGPHHLGI